MGGTIAAGAVGDAAAAVTTGFGSCCAFHRSACLLPSTCSPALLCDSSSLRRSLPSSLHTPSPSAASDAHLYALMGSGGDPSLPAIEIKARRYSALALPCSAALPYQSSAFL